MFRSVLAKQLLRTGGARPGEPHRLARKGITCAVYAATVTGIVLATAGLAGAAAPATAATAVEESSGPAEAATRVYTYKVCYAGKIVVSKPYFRDFAAATYADARGWRRAGLRFVRTDASCARLRNTDFTLYLAAPSYIARFADCSAAYSCRHGRHVMINQRRWRHAVPFWPPVQGLRGYRRMVINHETGHWLGQGHRSCPRRGAAAPVMQQQSIGLQGCRAHARPLPGEIRSARRTMP
jgi:hypothetical protein